MAEATEEKNQRRLRVSWIAPAIAAALGNALIAVSGYSDIKWPETIAHGSLLATGTCLLIVATVMVSWKITKTEALQRETKALRDRLIEKQDALTRLHDKRVFLIAASVFDNEWQAAFVQSLLYNMQQHNYEITVYVPRREFSGGEQTKHMDEIVQNKDNYSGGVLISMYSEKREFYVRNFAETFGKWLVIHDNSEQILPSWANYVPVLSSETGLLAAQAVLDIAETRSVSRVLVLAGTEQRARQDAFCNGVYAKISNVEIVVDPAADFDRNKAFVRTLANMHHAIEVKRHPFDVIFCTGDAMTLGCIDALRQIDFGDCKMRPKVIGHDGMQSVLRLFKENDPFLERVVVTDPVDLAELTVSILFAMIEKRDKPALWSRPFLYPRKTEICVK